MRHGCVEEIIVTILALYILAAFVWDALTSVF
jgi:hypothetical protein